MPTETTTATTDMAGRMRGPRQDVTYVQEPPRGTVRTVTPKPPTPRDWRPAR